MPKESDGTPVDCGGFADSDLAVSAPPASRALALGHEQPAAGGSKFLAKPYCEIASSLIISRVICSWPAASWSTVRDICS